MYGANGMATVLARAAMTGRRRGAFWRHRGPQPLQHPRRDHQSWWVPTPDLQLIVHCTGLIFHIRRPPRRLSFSGPRSRYARRRRSFGCSRPSAASRTRPAEASWPRFPGSSRIWRTPSANYARPTTPPNGSPRSVVRITHRTGSTRAKPVFPDVFVVFVFVFVYLYMCFFYLQSLQYNVPGGKKNRGLSLVLSYKTLCPRSELSDENLKLSYTLGWCVEIVSGFNRNHCSAEDAYCR